MLRAWNEHADPRVQDIYPYATTSPVYWIPVVAAGAALVVSALLRLRYTLEN